MYNKSMRLYYEENLTPFQARVLEANGWHILYCKDDPFYKDHIFDGLYMGSYIAKSADKEFNALKDGMFEIEFLLEVDVISDTDHDGGSIHVFRWKNPYWNGWTYDPQAEPVEPSRQNMEWICACGWDCAVHMYGAPESARATAIELQRLRSVFSK